MSKPYPPVYYADYLQLAKLLDAQTPISRQYGNEAHDETLFIIVHQVYELWFKQILHEVSTIIEWFNQDQLDDSHLVQAIHRLKRVVSIQRLLNDQISIIETMTPQDFLSFRDYLVPASGFQSIQFKMLEIGLGLKSHYRIDFDRQSFYQRLNDHDQQFLRKLEEQPSLFELVDRWLARMPFLQLQEFTFWREYQHAAETMLADDERTISDNQTLTEHDKEKNLQELANTRKSYAALFDDEQYQQCQQDGQVRLSRQAMLAALFIQQYSEQPVFNLANQFITCLTEIDENLTIWRYRHAMMVQRMLGGKIGTGGSSGHDYLKRTTESNRIFADFFNMATYLLPKSALPELPDRVCEQLGFHKLMQ